jgi:hypothetical protein
VADRPPDQPATALHLLRSAAERDRVELVVPPGREAVDGDEATV